MCLAQLTHLSTRWGNSMGNASYRDNDMRTPWDVVATPDNNHVYVSLYGSTAGQGGFMCYDLDAAGVLINPRFVSTTARWNRGATISPDGKHIYLCSHSDDAILWWEIDASGNLINPGSWSNTTYIAEPWDLVVAPNGVDVYAICISTDRITHFTRTVGTGALTLPSAAHSLQKPGSGLGNQLNGTKSLEITKDGKFVYVACSNGIVCLKVESDGTLSFISESIEGVGGVDGVGTCNDLAVSWDSKYVYAVGNAGSEIASFEIQPVVWVFV